MNLMSNENITWTVERERGISFDLTALTDPESRQPEGAALHDAMRREIKLEAESGVKESTFGHPFGGQFRPQPRPAPPSPFSRGGSGPPNKRMLPPSFELRDSSSAKRGQWDSSSSSNMASGGGGRPEHQQPRVLGRTRSRSVRPSAPKDKPPAASSSSSSFSRPSVGRSRSSHGGGSSSSSSSRAKVEAAEAARAAASSAPRRRYVGGVDTVALTAELGLVDRRRCARRNNSKGGAPYRVGAYTLEERAALVARFHAKRGRRIWRKKIKYDCRKKLADKRPRLKGRFVTQEELEGLDSETLAKVTGLGPWPAEDASSDADAGEASDSSEGYTGPALTTSRHRGANKSGAAGRRHQQQRRQEEEEEDAPGTVSPKSLCVKAAAKAAARAAANRNFVSVKKERDGEEDEDADMDDGSSSTSTSAASEESDKLSLSPGGRAEEEREEASSLGPRMGRVSSSCKVSDLFAVKTEADVDMLGCQDQGQHAEEEGEEEEDFDEDDNDVKVEGYGPTDPVFGFMVDDIMSSSFSAVVPSTDLEGISTVAVS